MKQKTNFLINHKIKKNNKRIILVRRNFKNLININNTFHEKFKNIITC